MTKEQLRHIQAVERTVDYLNERVKALSMEQCQQSFSPLSHYLDGAIPCQEFLPDADEYNKKVHDFALAELKKLQDKYLQMYAAL